MDVISEYYDGSKLLSLLDLNKKIPEIYMCTTNRTGGKTTWFNRFVMSKFLKGEGKFAVLVRFAYEVDDFDNAFFKDIQPLFFPEYNYYMEKKVKGLYANLYIGKGEEKANYKNCGYVIPLNSADGIKKRSHIFNDVNRILFDEFQPLDNKYCPMELIKFYSIHTSIARGHRKKTRYVPVYMASNRISIINPYYVALGITSRLKDDTNFLRGNGYVLENGFVEDAARELENSAFSQAFSNVETTKADYGKQSIYLNDSKAFISKPEKSKSRYLATIKYNDAYYAIREYVDLGIIYCDKSPDHTFPLKIAITLDDHQINYVMLKHNEMFVLLMRDYFNHGAFRFQDLMCKDAILNLISY